MKEWENKIVFITGGGSGIGRALAKGVVNKGAKVIIADINIKAANETVKTCGKNAYTIELDVRDSDAFHQCVDFIFKKFGRIDCFFNNVGIGVSGEVEEIPLEVWNRIIDINIRGVVNGIERVYPIMVEQGFGTIVNTASLAGLSPSPLLTPYSMTKHAIVGLSKSLRIEASAKGVQVNVICPAAIETPLIDADNPTDLPPVPWKPNVRRFLSKLSGKPYAADKMAEDVFIALKKNVGIIVLPSRAKMIWKLDRLFPKMIAKKIEKVVNEERQERNTKK